MSKQTLGGTLFCHQGISQDYCISEAIISLKELCDEVILVEVGSNDGTTELMQSFADHKTKVICLPIEEWEKQKGRQKLAYFTNVAIASLSTDWNFNLQSDEIADQRSFDTIREAIEVPGAESYWSRRINMWCDSKHYLDVPENRKPVGDIIIRLARTKYLSIDDAQSIAAQPADWTFYDKIKIYHMGFIRSKYVHTKKIKHMLEEVFLMGGNDPKVEAMGEVFDCWGMGFDKNDVKLLTEPLPIFVQQWAEERDKINNFEI